MAIIVGNNVQDNSGVTNITLTTSGRPSFPAGLQGGGEFGVATKTTTYTITDTDGLRVVLASATGGAFTVTLPAAASNASRILFLKKTDSSANAVTIDGAGSETIEGALTLVLDQQFDCIEIASDGSNWHLVNAQFPLIREAKRIHTDATVTGGTSNTFVDILGGGSGVAGLPLVPGRYLLGFAASIKSDTAANTYVVAGLHDGTASITNSRHISQFSSGNNSEMFGAAIKYVTTASVTIKIEAASNNPYGAGLIWEGNPLGGISDENTARIWAQRLG